MAINISIIWMSSNSKHALTWSTVANIAVLDSCKSRHSAKVPWFSLLAIIYLRKNEGHRKYIVDVVYKQSHLVLGLHYISSFDLWSFNLSCGIRPLNQSSTLWVYSKSGCVVTDLSEWLIAMSGLLKYTKWNCSKMTTIYLIWHCLATILSWNLGVTCGRSCDVVNVTLIVVISLSSPL